MLQGHLARSGSNKGHDEDRVVGAMLGLACGDALGAPAEFKSQAQVQAQFGELRDMVGSGLWKPGEWTDDTGMALCIAEGILADAENPVEHTGQCFLEWRKSAKDVGTTISAALSGFRGDWAQAARNTPQARQGKAAGNGSLMRTLPVAIAYADQALMLRQSARLSAMTHWDAQAEVCCAVYCLWIQELLNGASLHEGWHSALAAGRAVERVGQLSPDTPGPAPLSEGFWARLEGVEALEYHQLQPSGYAGYVVECLEAAAWCCLKSPSLEEALIQAVNLAGEADTIAAVAGGIVGAHWGKHSIPQRWLDSLYRRPDVEHIAIRLAALRSHLNIYTTRGLPAFNYDEVCERVIAGRNPLTGWDVQTLTVEGVTHVLDLRQPHEWSHPNYGEEAIEAIERCGLKRLHLEVRDMGEPTPEDLEKACRYFDEILTDPAARIYVHCRAGMERTAAVLIAYYARKHGVSYDEALSELRKGRPIFKPLPLQEQAIRQWLNL